MLGRSTIVLGRSTMVLERSTMVQEGLPCSASGLAGLGGQGEPGESQRPDNDEQTLDQPPKYRAILIFFWKIRNFGIQSSVSGIMGLNMNT